MSTFPGPQDPFATPEVEPRTSIVAVVSIVCSLICCVPIMTGMLGAFLGVIALFLIGSSHGQLKGRGFAFGGVVLGLLVSMLWIGVLLGLVRTLGGYANSGAAAFESIDAGDIAQSRAAFMAPLDQSVSDEQIEAFGKMIHDDFGGFVSKPNSLLEYWSGISNTGPSGSSPALKFGEVPIVLEYESGDLLAIMNMYDGSSQPSADRFLSDLGYQRPDGTIVWLSEIELNAALDAPAAPEEPGEPGEPDDSGGSGEADEPGEPGQSGESGGKGGG